MKTSERLLNLLQQVNSLHTAISIDTDLSTSVRGLQAWQNQRIAETYADFNRQAEYQYAVKFMVNDLYGGESLSKRDQQMEKAFTAMVKYLPEHILGTVATAMELSLLSNTLDRDLALKLDKNTELNEASYCAALRASDSFDLRIKQVALTKKTAEELARIVKLPFISMTLKICRTPAKLAGLNELQDYLERGFHAFKTMKSPAVFFNAMVQRETQILNNIFSDAERPFDYR